MKKGQQPLEHIAVYAWTFIILSLFIWVLFYFNLFSLERYSSQVCSFDANFFCHDFIIQKNGPSAFDMNVLLQNNMNKEIVLNQVDLLDEDGDPIICADLNVYCRFDEPFPYLVAAPSNGGLLPIASGNWTPTRLCKLEFLACPGTVSVDYKKEANLRMDFSRVGNPASHLSYGLIYATVVAP